MAETHKSGNTSPKISNGEDLNGALDCREHVADSLLESSREALAESYIALQEHRLRIELHGGRIARALNRLGLTVPKELKSDLDIARAQINNALTLRISTEEIRQNLPASDPTHHEEPGLAEQ
jgi:hypothetical protein